MKYLLLVYNKFDSFIDVLEFYLIKLFKPIFKFLGFCLSKFADFVEPIFSKIFSFIWVIIKFSFYLIALGLIIKGIILYPWMIVILFLADINSKLSRS